MTTLAPSPKAGLQLNFETKVGVYSDLSFLNDKLQFFFWNNGSIAVLSYLNSKKEVNFFYVY